MNKSTSNPTDFKPNPSPSDEVGAKPPRKMSSSELFGQAREIVIVHAGSEYRLRVTSNDKLILTK